MDIRGGAGAAGKKKVLPSSAVDQSLDSSRSNRMTNEYCVNHGIWCDGMQMDNYDISSASPSSVSDWTIHIKLLVSSLPDGWCPAASTGQLGRVHCLIDLMTASLDVAVAFLWSLILIYTARISSSSSSGHLRLIRYPAHDIRWILCLLLVINHLAEFACSLIVGQSLVGCFALYLPVLDIFTLFISCLYFDRIEVNINNTFCYLFIYLVYLWTTAPVLEFLDSFQQTRVKGSINSNRHLRQEMPVAATYCPQSVYVTIIVEDDFLSFKWKHPVLGWNLFLLLLLKEARLLFIYIHLDLTYNFLLRYRAQFGIVSTIWKSSCTTLSLFIHSTWLVRTWWMDGLRQQCVRACVKVEIDSCSACVDCV